MPRSFSFGLLLIRLALGFLLARHGWTHFTDFAAFVKPAGGLLLASGAVLGQLAGGLGLMIGFLTRGAAAGAGVVMLAIAFTKHADGLRALGAHGGVAFEYPALAGVVALAFFFTGAGDYSLDRVAFGKFEP